MKLDDWILALHLLSAFALVGAITMFSIGLVSLRSVEIPGRALAVDSALKVAKVAVGIGGVGTIVFGVWLAISLDSYQVWDLWVLLAIAGWAIATETGRRAGLELDKQVEQARQLVAEGKDDPNPDLAAAFRSSRAHVLSWTAAAVTLLVLIDMIWKPGA